MSDGYEYEYTPSSESKFKPKLDKLKEFFSKLKENASFGKKFFAHRLFDKLCKHGIKAERKGNSERTIEAKLLSSQVRGL